MFLATTHEIEMKTNINNMNFGFDMATLWILQRPESFNLPFYERREMESSEEFEGTNYTFVKKIPDVGTTLAYMLGEYFEMRDEQQFPEESDVISRTYSYPTVIISYLYILSQGQIMYCIGNNIDSIRNVMTKHTTQSNFPIISIDLDMVEDGFRRGLIGISGHSYTSEQGTIRNIVRKVDPIPFSPDEASYATGDDVNKEYLEVLMSFTGVNKRFKVYPDGKITIQGRTESGTTGFEMLFTVYSRIREIIQLVSRPQNQR